MITIHYRTLQRVADMLPKKTYMSSAIDAFLTKIHQEIDDAIREITASGATSSTITIKVQGTASDERKTPQT